MQFVSPIPFSEAIDLLGQKSVIGSQLSSSEWQDVPLELRLRAFFSSRVESVQQLQQMKDLIADFLAGQRLSLGSTAAPAVGETAPVGQTMLKVGSRAAFVNQMQQYLAASGIDRTTGDIQDITSQARLSLIFDIQTRSAQSFGNWQQGLDPDVLDAFPAMRFIRVRDVKEPRQSHEQYQDQVFLKSDPIWWLVINKDFGVPWAPFGWGCGHDTEDVDRPWCEKHGLLRPGQRVEAPKLPFNHNLGASIRRLDPELVSKLKTVFGDQVVVDEADGLMRWLGQRAAENIGAPLTRADRDTILEYTITLFADLNAAFRAGRPDIAVLKQADALSQALAKLPVYTGVVHRLTDIPAAVLAEYQPGNIVTSRGFLSTTAGPTISLFGDTVEFEIISKNGRRIRDYSAAPDQDEVLFDQRTQFKVLARTEHAGRLLIRMEEL